MSPASLKGVTLPRLRMSPSCAVGILFLASIGCGSLPSFDPQNHVSVSSTANPLVAQYTINQLKSGAAAWVEFGTDTNYGRRTSPVTDSASTSPVVNLNVLVAGMLPQTTYHMRAHVNGSSGVEWVDEDRTFTTGALPAGVVPPGLTVTRPAPGSSPAPGVELLSLIP
jgi:arylsulfate sulfotransferase